MKKLKPVPKKVLVPLVAGVFLILWVGIRTRYGHLLTVEGLRAHAEQFLQAYRDSPGEFVLAYVGVYLTAFLLCIPGAATILTLTSGLIFGLLRGVPIVLVAATLASMFSFLIARYLLQDWITERFAERIKRINEGVERDGVLFLLTLRFLPVVPYFIVNMGMGMTRMPLFVFSGITFLGMIPGAVAYVNAGTQLATIESARDVLSPRLLASFACLALLPWVARLGFKYRALRKVYRRYSRPSHYDYNLVVIGAGSGGLIASYIAATVKAKVALIERDRMGGDCLNTGCVPSKALLRSARMLSYAARAREFGFRQTQVDFDFAQVMERVSRVIAQIEPHDSVQRYEGLGVECVAGNARIVSPFEVEVGGRRLTTRSIVIASGSEPVIPGIPGLSSVPYVTSDTVWALRQLPRSLLVLGGGPIGCELAQAFARFGSKVTQVERGERLLVREDDEASRCVRERFEREGIRVLTGHEVREFRSNEGVHSAICAWGASGASVEVQFDLVLIALGRKARTQGFGLEELGIHVNAGGTIETNEFLATKYPNVYVCGDAAGPYQFTHVAAHQAWFASVNALFGELKSFRADYRVIPWATFTDPEVARVGLNEQEARAQGVPYEVTTYPVSDLDRAIADSEAHGFVKVLTKPGKDRILGVTIVGDHAGDWISEFVLAMKQGIGLNQVLGTTHIYPTWAEANRSAAGLWKKAHAPERALRWLGKYHQWRRGKGKNA